MNAVLKRILRKVRITVPGLAPHMDEIDFHSGLGDSAYLLYGLARALKPRVAVEIGSARGKSACYVGRALKENGSGKLFAIDPHTRTNWNDENSIDTLDEMRRNISAFGIQKQVEIIRDISERAAARWMLPIDLLFIDGDHSYEGVKRDWELFMPHVVPFGLVVFHDTLWDLKPDSPYSRSDMGVPAFVEELRLAGYPVTTLDHDFGVSLVQPTPNGIPLRKYEPAARQG
ncbi:MAG TPA: class I SAM-dependent methyltransferase [Gemmatimonadaceae bacterium]